MTDAERRLDDATLEWCSERVESDNARFDETYRWLRRQLAPDSTREPGLVRYELETLGHLETSAGRWAIAPTTISILDGGAGNAVLSGARPRWLKQRLLHLQEDDDPAIRSISQRVAPEMLGQRGGHGPSVVYLTAPEDELISTLCDRLGIRFEHRVTTRLEAALPNLDWVLGIGAVPSPPPGFEFERLVVGDDLNARSARRWVPWNSDREAGAYQYRRYGPDRYLFNDGEGLWAADQHSVQYAELRRLKRSVLWHDAADEQLYVSARFPLPMLFSRTAVLRTGQLPQFSHSHAVPGLGPGNCYENIPRPLAETIASKLGQNLQPTGAPPR